MLFIEANDAFPSLLSIFQASSQHLWRKQTDIVLRHPSDTNMR